MSETVSNIATLSQQLRDTHNVSGAVLGLAVFTLARTLVPDVVLINPGDHNTWLTVFAALELDTQRALISEAHARILAVSAQVTNQ